MEANEPNNNTCVKCKQACTEECYKCDSCLNRIHKACTNITASEAKCMPLQKRILMLICEDCKLFIARMPFMMKILEELKMDMEAVKTSMERNTYAGAHERIERLERRILENKKEKSPRPKHSNIPRDKRPSALTVISGAPETGHDEKLAPDDGKRASGAIQHRSTSRQSGHKDVIPCDLAATSPANANNDVFHEPAYRNNESKTNDWNLVKGRRNRTKVDRDIDQTNRPKPLKGAKQEACSLKTARRMALLFITGLAPETTAENVSSFLKSCDLGDNCRCEKIRTRRERYCSSFKLAIPIEERAKYFCTELWPEGVTVNHFMNLQSQGRVRPARSPTPRK